MQLLPYHRVLRLKYLPYEVLYKSGMFLGVFQFVKKMKLLIRPTLMHTKNLYENGPNPFFFFGTKNMSEGHLMHTVLVCYVFDKLGQACLCG